MAPEQHRVAFDFELAFTNGGGLAGTDFRLDIPGDEVTDVWIAEAIVRDLRLLMVGEIRIRNRRVFAEAHKRAAPAAAHPAHAAQPAAQPAPSLTSATPGQAPRRLVDLSHPIVPGMVTYPGLPVPEIRHHLEREASRVHYAPGVEFQIDVLTVCGNTGTYLDSPFHRYDGGTDLAGLPLERLVDLPAVVVDVGGSATRRVGANELRPFDLAGRAVLVRTGFDRHWGTDAYLRDNPFVTRDAADLLAAEGAALVGIDSLNIDDMGDTGRPAHSILLGAGIPVCEHLTGLGALPIEGARFTAVPAPFRETGTFAVRAFATIPVAIPA
jgi:kynurenine formamidase